jgi:hypothetical protein
MHALSAQTNNILPVGVQVTPEGVSAPAIVINKFNIDYPNVNPVWQMDNDDYAAAYTDGITNTQHLIVYDEDGNLIRKDIKADNTSYPRAVENYLTKNYPNEKYTVWISEDISGVKTYYAKRNSTYILFDKDGKSISNKIKKSSNK